MSNHTLPPAAAPQAPSDTERIAVIGMGCRLPGDTASPAALWRLLAEGRDAVGALPPERRRLLQGESLGRGDPGTPASPPGGYLREVAGFDAAFFGVAGREADVLDPQHRLLLEVTWEALEHAGLPPERMHATPTAVFTGISYGDYMDQLTGTPHELEGSILTNGHCVAAGRVSYLLGLHGPSVALDTACSSSLVAVHMARQALCAGECDLALAGGVTLTFQPRVTRSFARMGMLSAGGRCRTFDAGADGFVRGEGCGVVVLKRLRDAVRDGDRVLAVIRGSATNQDGSSDGLAAPSAAAQRALYREALHRSGTDPRDVGMVETHGTGTPVGDPVEFAGLADVYGDGPGRCALTSVKTNLGHLEPAAGVTGLIKAVLCLQRGAVPANLHFRRWNPAIAADGTRFFVPTELTSWPLPAQRRLAAVSSFGFSGTNAHVLLEEAPEPPAPRRPEEPAPAAPDVFLVPAGSPGALPAAAGALADWLTGEGAQVPLRDLAHTLALRRCAGRGRMGVVTTGRRELLSALRAFAAGERHPAVVTGAVDAAVERRPVWVFSGHGSQWPGMGRGLLRTEPAFAEALDEAAALIRSESRVPVLDIIRKGRPVKGCGEVQPVLFALQIALAATWRSYGVEPAAVIGHSMGEVAAAVVAGALTLADGVRVICRRSGLLSDIAGTGGMVSVGLSADAVREELAACAAESVSVAVLSSPDTTVVAGRTAEVSRLAAAWEARGIAVLPIAVDVASHCPLVDPVLPALRSALAGLRPRPPEVRFYSTAVEAGATPSFDADYWCDNLRRPVRFAEAVAAAAADRHQVYLELSPHPIVSHSVERSLSGLATSPAVLPTLRRDEDEPATLRTQLAALHCSGVPVDWRRLYDGGNLVDAPTLTFDRRHHWAEAARPPAPAAPAATGLPGHHTEVPGEPVRHCWRADAGVDALPWLADHQVHGSPVMPGAAWCGIALAAATEVFGAAPHEVDVTDVHFEQLLRLDRHTGVSTVVTMAAPDRAHCQILTRGEDGDWERQADAVLHRLTVRPAPRPRSIEAFLVRHPVRLDPADLYRNLRGRGLEHGPAFTGITELRTERHHGSYFARITVPPRAHDPAPGLPVHPVLLDVCAQLAVAPLMHEDDTAPVLPVAVQAVRVLGDPARAEYCHAHIGEHAPDGVVANVRLLDGDGAVVAAVNGLRFVRRAVRDEPAAADWLLEIGWQRSGRAAAEDGRAPGSWFLVGEADGSARVLAAALRSRCARTTVWDRPLDDTPLETLRDSLGERLAAGLEPPRAVVLVCGRRSAAEPAGESLRRTRRLLATVQAIAAGPAAPRLHVLTQGARNVLPDDTVDLGQSALRGLVRVAALEHPELRPTLLDTDPRHADPADVAEELLADTEDDEVALRAGERWAARLRRAPAGQERPPAHCTVRYGVDGFRLRAGRLGDLSSLEYAVAGRRPPRRGEVEVRVTAAGLNFRDVLTAMGLLPGDEDVRSRIGFECAGVVSAVGEGVEHLEVGDGVVAVELRGGAFGSFLTVPAEGVAPIPAGLDPVTAAGLPIAFLTAWYALRHVAGLKSGERVLIHSATGGTGLAAIAVARSLEAEVLATAGSEDKRRYLRGMGIRHVMDSRSLDFGEQIREATGDGVDVVLNSLSGAAIRTGLETLRPFGRFVELGVRDILSDAPMGMRPLRHNVTLRTVDLIELRRHRPGAFAAVWQEVLDAFGAGQLTPLHCTEYPLPEATTAFRTMAAADHLGKLVLTVPSSGQARAVLPELDLPVREGGAYLVTGGLRGVGLATARWLAEQGAGHVVLNGRTPPSPEAARQIGALRKGATKVTVVLGDIAEPGTAERLVTTAASGGHRLRGVVHCAMVLDDAVLANATDEQLERVWRPKTAGAWRLHQATEGCPLDWFAAFSSMASLLGNPGQGAYAAANSWLDGFAAWRSAQGLPTLAVNWGPWGETGVATDFGRRGYRTIPTDEGMAALRCLLAQRRVQTGVLPGPADTWLPAAGRHLPFFRDVQAGGAAAPPPAPEDGADLPARLAALPAGLARRTALEECLADHVRAVLRLGDGALDPQVPLKSMGFDSLLALELRARIERTFAVSVPRNFVWQHPTLAELAAGVADRLGLEPDAS
ncbi:polyketide synthase [Streptomyces sp. NRRL F-4489]|uniref:type I polyketide synthase n=1 Tax=Streptomyces sp. NRRL F-4489 TaxID=1609095 RepID=UPI00074655B2|nr:type I polyketide synthase [Streptomyces sp. NRRL F-4489]KUL43815.1 polyketide synthase [Streptomyces sp. NRRL F-4489]